MPKIHFCRKAVSRRIEHASHNQLSNTAPNIHIHWVAGRLVPLSYKHGRSNLHCGDRDLARIGTERDKFGSLVAKFHSANSGNSRTTRSRSATTEEAAIVISNSYTLKK